MSPELKAYRAAQRRANTYRRKLDKAQRMADWSDNETLRLFDRLSDSEKEDPRNQRINRLDDDA